MGLEKSLKNGVDVKLIKTQSAMMDIPMIYWFMNLHSAVVITVNPELSSVSGQL